MSNGQNASNGVATLKQTNIVGQRVGYVRVSSVEQSTARQLAGIELDEVFQDKVSGKDANRPGLQAAIKHCRKGDELFVHSIDRLARNIVDLRNIVEELTNKGVRVTFVKNSLTFTNSPADKMMLTMLGAFAEFERDMILERQREGIAIAKAAGKYKGRKPALSDAKAAEFSSRVKAGEPVAKLATEFGISRATAYEYAKAAKA